MSLCKLRISLLLTFIIVIPVKGQFKNYNTESEIWYHGTVYDNQGNATDGLINYNFVVDNIRLKVGDEITTLIPKNVSRFTLEDSTSSKHDFYSVPFDFQKQGREVPTFFMKIYQNDNYLLLSKHFIDFKNDKIPVPYVNATVKIVKEKVSQVIFIADGKKEITPCLEKKKVQSLTLDSITLGYNDGYYYSNKNADASHYNERHLETSSTSIAVDKYKLTDSNVFKHYFGSKYGQIEDYLQKNEIDIQTIDGLIKAIDFAEAN